VFYGLKQDHGDLQISVQIKGLTLDIIEEDIQEIIQQKDKKSENSEDSENERDPYEKQSIIYIKPNLKENGIL